VTLNLATAIQRVKELRRGRKEDQNTLHVAASLCPSGEVSLVVLGGDHLAIYKVVFTKMDLADHLGDLMKLIMEAQNGLFG